MPKRNPVSSVWEVLLRGINKLDWYLISVLAAFAVAQWYLVSTIRDLFGPEKKERDAAHIAYETAIADAAVKRPAYAVPLRVIPPDMAMVNVVSFGRPDPIDPKSRSFDMWVALPDELRGKCKGAQDPVRRLQEILGLPPMETPSHVVTEVQVSRSGLLRPCVAGGDVAKPYCNLELQASAPLSATGSSASGSIQQLPVDSGGHAQSPEAPIASASSASAPSGTASVSEPPPASSVGSNSPGSPDAANLAYENLLFVTRQMWNTSRIDFRASYRKPGDYPYTGFPFTGMGWTYDWSDVSNHIGVSEFVIRRIVPITVVNTKAPADFCAE